MENKKGSQKGGNMYLVSPPGASRSIYMFLGLTHGHKAVLHLAI